MNEKFVPFVINEDDANIPIELELEDRENIIVNLQHVKVMYNVLIQYRDEFPAMATVEYELIYKLKQIINDAIVDNEF